MNDSHSSDLPFDLPPSLTSASVELSRDAWGQLAFTDANGQRHDNVIPIRAFPITDSNRHLSICDGRGAELAYCEDMAHLADDVRRMIEDDLARRDFIPNIERIVRISSGLSPEWTVETDRGQTTFVIETEENVRRLGRHQATITDTHGMRYLIRDLRALDAPSRRMLERFL
ncbi:MAG TPA: DUF1854 domain-containing protein [Pirellulales bacterium]|nr:DUF1854 domain-containing protein [Pirellulales bacterium]